MIDWKFKNCCYNVTTSNETSAFRSCSADLVFLLFIFLDESAIFQLSVPFFSPLKQCCLLPSAAFHLLMHSENWCRKAWIFVLIHSSRSSRTCNIFTKKKTILWMNHITQVWFSSSDVKNLSNKAHVSNHSLLQNLANYFMLNLCGYMTSET